MKKKLVAAVCIMSMLLCCVVTGCGQEPTDKGQDAQVKEEQTVDLEGHNLMIYCGAGMTKPFQEIADAFKAETKCEMNVTFANAGQIQSQINTSEEGDMFIAGSAEELKPVESFVKESKDLVKHIPVLIVGKGNPKEINGLADLTKEDVSFVMGDVESTPIGKIAKKALTKAGIFDKVNIIANTTTAPQMATVVQNKEADAAIIWKENSNVDGVEMVKTTDLDKFIKTIPAAELSCAADQEAVKAFKEYLDSDAAKKIWQKYGYELV